MLWALAESFPLRKPRGGAAEGWWQPSGRSMPALPPACDMAGQGAIMQLVRMNGEMMRQLTQASRVHGRDGDDIRLDMVPPKKPKLALRDIIADGPPPMPSGVLALPPPPLPPPRCDPPSSMKKKKKGRKGKPVPHAIAPAVPLAIDPAVSEKAKTSDAIDACGGVLESLLTRHKSKKSKADDEIPKGKGKPKAKAKTTPSGCSKCRYLKNGCSKCRSS